MTTPAVSPYVPYYADVQPYLTVAEFLAEPTGVDTTQLIPGGTQPANESALAIVIASASAYADAICNQILAATVDVKTGQYRLQRDGSIIVPLDYTPVISVTGVLVGVRAGQLTALTDLSGLWFRKKSVQIPVYPALQFTSTAVGVAARAGSVFTQVTYVNGYANTSLAADAVQGATSLTLVSATGVFAGMPFTIYDTAAGTTEAVTVDASYTIGSTTVPLTSGLVAAHTAGTAVSALPRTVKEATAKLTAHLIKTRGAEALTLAGVSGGPSKITPEAPGASEEYDTACRLLARHHRTW